MNGHKGEVCLLTGNAHQQLARNIATFLGIELVDAEISRFNDGEIKVEVSENIRGKDIFILQPTCQPVNDHLMELVLMIDAAKRASANRVTVVMPYFGYARQDRKASPRAPISARVIANMLETAGADRILTLDLHAGQIQGFFNVPVDNLHAGPLLVFDVRRSYDLRNLMVVAPDAGGVQRARAVAKKLGVPLALLDKRRDKPGSVEEMMLIGDVRGKDCLLIDDIVDTAGTLCKASDALLDSGAAQVSAYITHPVLSGPAIDRISNSSLKEVVVTDSIPLKSNAAECGKIRVASCAMLLAEAIRRVAEELSIQELYEEGVMEELETMYKGKVAASA